MPRLGIIAGGGNLPKNLIAACLRDKRDFFVLGVRGHADKDIMQGVPHAWGSLGATNSNIQTLKDNGVDTVVMAGAIRRPSLREIKPDWRTIQVVAKLGSRAFGDDELLRAVAAELEKDGLKVVGAHEIDPTLITPPGVLGKIKPSAEHLIDIAAGVKIAKTLGALDTGQGVVVQQGIVLGVEAVEGTDALIARCKTLRRKGGGGVLVKSCKPQQDRRVDLPAIGQRTVRNAFEAGLEGIAIEAGASIILDRAATVDAADRLGLFVTGFEV